MNPAEREAEINLQNVGEELFDATRELDVELHRREAWVKYPGLSKEAKALAGGRGRKPKVDLKRAEHAGDAALKLLLDSDDVNEQIEDGDAPREIRLNAYLWQLEIKSKEVLDKRFPGEKDLTEKSRAAIAEFHGITAVFTVYLQSQKLLYQTLLEEYLANGLLEPVRAAGIRRTAVDQITRLLAAGDWTTATGSRRREQFRAATLHSIRQAVDAQGSCDEERPCGVAALCLSGGGIRSATFSLGVIQALAAQGLLSRFDYLSTVSGGGYMGSWLTAWIHRLGKVDLVQQALSERKENEVEPAPVTYLRSYSNFMSPKVGLGSADTWTLIGVYLRNLLLNWAVVVPLLAAFLLLPRLLYQILLHGKGLIGETASLAGGLFMFAFGVTGAFAVSMVTAYRPSLGQILPDGSPLDQTYRRDDIGATKSVELKVVGFSLLPLLLFAIGITTYWHWSPEGIRLAAMGAALTNFDPWWARIFFLSVTTIFAAAALTDFNYYRQSKTGDRWNPLYGILICLLCIGMAATQLFILPGNKILFLFVLFFEAIFLFGGFFGRVAVAYLSGRNSRKLLENVGTETSISFLAASVGGLFLYLFARHFNKLHPNLAPNDPFAIELFATLAVPFLLLSLLIAGTVFVGLGSKLIDEMDHEWMSRLGAWILMIIVIWLVVFGVVLFGPLLTGWDMSGIQGALASVGGIAGVITLLVGYYAKNSTGNSVKPTKKSFLVSLIPQIAAPLFAAFLMVLTVLGTDALLRFVFQRVSVFDANGSVGNYVICIALLVLIGSLMGYFVNINKFSLHGMYRERLIRAYLGASRGDERLASANSFTGLDDGDNIDMWRTFQRPFHVVNMALNVAGTKDLKWQYRKAESFTVTPLYCGSSNMGGGAGSFRSSKVYGADRAGKPISLGTAAAISGAAASPNMGYFTQSAPVSALMALFNVRLGWWLGNPGRRGGGSRRSGGSYMKGSPTFATRLFVDEALGRTGDSSRYVYLSDGGHFDNLGLYEMVLRRCRLIVVVDATCDSEFGLADLGTAIHKIRVDMGIPIEFAPGDAPAIGRNCSRAMILYSAVDGKPDADPNDAAAQNGTLIYIKPTLDGNVPMDIVNYRSKFTDFPHESTADQMYSEIQFESYRILGQHMMNSICGYPNTKCDSFAKLIDRTNSYLDSFDGEEKRPNPPPLRA